MAALDPTGRFSSRVDDYIRYRPSYPREIVPLLARECGLNADSTIADVGSGTGFLTKLFLDFGCAVIGVEPNKEMREAGQRVLAQYQRFASVDGRAEQTGLADASVDLIAAGQAFHWFDPTATRPEFRRILRAPRWVALVWNERLVTGDFLAGYEDLVLRYGPDYRKIDHRRIDADRISEFFEHRNWKLATFPNVQHFDWTGLRGRLESSSYAPRPGDKNYEPIMAELRRLYESHQKNGRVDFLYSTNVYYGTL
ncbi:MAG TPA: class I SAM-dependent methyltransferase [Bryobacteraceae bacterium]|nr:class I SAM-dependent methyltransferase [Bryobacteraceae bacterium]